jgi:hypothetical protein
MSTFYVLPPRPLVADRLCELLRPMAPDHVLPAEACTELADSWAALVGRQRDVYVVFREDLPSGEEIGRALVDGFGANPGDEMIEVRVVGGLTAIRRRLAA